jgi:hypothetical protein
MICYTLRVDAAGRLIVKSQPVREAYELTKSARFPHGLAHTAVFANDNYWNKRNKKRIRW